MFEQRENKEHTKYERRGVAPEIFKGWVYTFPYIGDQEHKR